MMEDNHHLGYSMFVTKRCMSSHCKKSIVNRQGIQVEGENNGLLDSMQI